MKRVFHFTYSHLVLARRFSRGNSRFSPASRSIGQRRQRIRSLDPATRLLNRRAFAGRPLRSRSARVPYGSKVICLMEL